MDGIATENRFAARAAELLPREGGIVVGVSGGADSVALLHLLCRLSEREGWSFQPHVAHLNHQLRGEESAADADFVQALAASLHVPCTLHCCDVAAHAEREGLSLEEAGRACRYAFFERVCSDLGIRALALGHHADDNVETILHRILRGTGLRGLAGIPEQRPLRVPRSGPPAGGADSGIQLIRPVLGFRRVELEDYLRGRGIAWREDWSNAGEEYTRNRIRNVLLPDLREQFNPQVDDAILRLSAQAGEAEEYLAAAANRLIAAIIIEREPQRLVVDCARLSGEPRVVRSCVLREALKLLGCGERQLTYEHLTAAAETAASRAGRRELQLPGGVRLVREYDRLTLTTSHETAGDDEAVGASIEVPVPSERGVVVPDCGIELTVEVLSPDAETLADYLRRRRLADGPCMEEWVDADSVSAPLTARACLPGDRFRPLGMTGTKKLSDYFIDEKVTAAIRKRAVILCDRQGPVWVVPLRIDDRVRLNPSTRRVLRLIAREWGAERNV